MSKTELSHIDSTGRPTMVDVQPKTATDRTAVASGEVHFPPEVFEQLRRADFIAKKGGIIATARLAGIMAVKKTADLIPLCHPLPLTFIDVDIRPEAPQLLRIRCTVKCHAPTGVEMEALTGVAAAALTIYDMGKALSHRIRITNIQLEQKTGGKTDYER